MPPDSCWILVRLTPLPRSWWQCYPPKHRLNSTGLHGVISWKIEKFMTTAVRTSIQCFYEIPVYTTFNIYCIFSVEFQAAYILWLWFCITRLRVRNLRRTCMFVRIVHNNQPHFSSSHSRRYGGETLRNKESED